MNKEDLIAPSHYNLVSEFEKYGSDENRLALIWESDKGEKKQITYKNLILRANKIANVFTNKGLKKGDVVLIMVPRLIEAYEVYIAALKAGLVVIPSSEMLRAKILNIVYHIVKQKRLYLTNPSCLNMKR